MKGGAYGHEVGLPWQGASKNTTKTFIVRHFSNAVMVHNNGQVWLWSPTHLKPRRHFPYQGVRQHCIVTGSRERRQGEPHRSQVCRQRRGVDTVLKHRGYNAMQQRHMEVINSFVEPAHTPSPAFVCTPA
jgi:hypothetical protein